MDFVGAWLRQLLKAGTAAALVPAAMIAALVVVLIGAGGFGGVGSIRQLLSGPEIPPAERLASSDRGARGGDVARVAPADEPRAVRQVQRRRPSSREAVPPPAAQPQPRPPAVDPGARETVRPPRPPAIEPPPPPPPPPAAPPPTLADRTEALGEKVGETLGDVGTLLEAIVEALVQTLGRIVTPPPHSAPLGLGLTRP